MDKIELVKISTADYSVIQNLARFYAYDMSRDCGQKLPGWEFPENGLYESSDFWKYLVGENKHPFLIKIAGELAGFAIINKLEVMPEVDWNMGEFFIVAKFQRSGLGSQIAKQLFEQFQGEWSVGAIPENKRAVNFWQKIIAEYTKANFHVVEKTSEQLKTAEHPDPYPMRIFRFKSPPNKSKPNREVILREPALEDEKKFLAMTQQSQSFHQPWVYAPLTHKEYIDYIHRYQQRYQKSFLLYSADQDLIGVFNLSEIVQGFFQSAYLGFFVGQHYAGQGWMSVGLKLLLNKVFDEIGLHRLEANIQPENESSILLVQRNGFRKEGFSPRYLKIGKEWRDHERWAITVEDWRKSN